MPPIGDGSQAYTDDNPRYSEKTFHIAPQTNPEAAATTGFQALHFLTYEPTRDEGVEVAAEYGGAISSVDPTDPEFGDVNFGASLSRRLCLNEEAVYLAYALGKPTTTDNADGTFTHVYQSGKSVLPLATLRDADSQNVRLVEAAFNALSLSIARGGGSQEVTSDLVPLNYEVAAAAALASGDQIAEMARLFVAKNNMRVTLDGTQLGKLLDASFNYTPDVQGERYVQPGDRINSTYVGDPSLSVGFGVRHVSEVQRAALGGKDTPLNIKIIGDGPSVGGVATSITYEMPRVKGPLTFPTKDDKMQKLNFTGNASRGSTDWMLKVTLVNTVNPFA